MQISFINIFRFLSVSVGISTASSASATAARVPRVPSADERQEKAGYFAFRGPTLSFASDQIGGEAGFEGGFFLAPQVLLLMQVQSGIIGKNHNDTIGNIHHIGLSARYFAGNSFFVGAGLQYGRLHFNQVHEESADYGDMSGPVPVDRYGSVTSASIGAPLAFGWQWQFHHFAIGFETISAFMPIVALESKGTFNPNYDRGSEDRSEPARKARQMGMTADFSLPRLLIGAAF